jgi:predicted ATP-grasp superfamily ATP-dependent carboligase
VQPGQNLLIFGASARAAAFSALRAGLQPWCVDLFADADLRARCPAMSLPPDRYPHGFLEYVHRELPGPWMYTGGLENRPDLVHEMSRVRPLWGNGSATLAVVRSPLALCRLLRGEGIACPAVHLNSDRVRPGSRWLVKPWCGAGGAGIRFWKGEPIRDRRRPTCYLQEYIEGEPCAAICVGIGPQPSLLGVTRQLIGESWLNAAPFHYCGSIGPLELTPAISEHLLRLAATLVESGRITSDSRVRGLFGVDFVLRDGVPWPVEVNPRYAASVEVLEYALGIQSLAVHRRAFDPRALDPGPIPAGSTTDFIGKAILFARMPIVFPDDGPWLTTLRHPLPIQELQAFADIPAAGQPIKTGRPILTFFARSGSETACLDTLRQIARDLDRWLFRT